MVPVAHLPVMSVWDMAVEARGDTKVIYTAKIVINTKPTLEQLALAEANETHVAAASTFSYVPNEGDGKAGASLSLGIA
eukprot:2948797-Ditylum_brightwellii.AAC.1